MHKGIAALITVILVTILSLFVLVAWQSRILLSIQRYQSLSDSLVVGYRAESTINDWIAKFLGNYADIYNPAIASCTDFTCDGSVQQQQDLPNKLLVVAKKVGLTERLDIAASRPYASTSFQLSRKLNTTGGFKNLDTVMSLDCTGSMNYPANTSCYQACGGCDETECYAPGEVKRSGNYATLFAQYKSCMAANSCVSRMSALKSAAVNFAQGYQSFGENYMASNPGSEVRLGLVVFKVDAAIPQTLTTNSQSIVSSLQTGLDEWQASSSLCSSTKGWTSVGTGFDVANEIHRNNISVNKKQINVLITDGEPNSRGNPANPLYCPGTACCGELGPDCPGNRVCGASEPFSFLQCSLKNTSDGGSRVVGIDNYAVTTLDNPSAELKSIFEEKDGYDYVKRYFNAPDATQLNTILEDILTSVVTGFQEIKIEKVSPAP